VAKGAPKIECVRVGWIRDLTGAYKLLPMAAAQPAEIADHFIVAIG